MSVDTFQPQPRICVRIDHVCTEPVRKMWDIERLTLPAYVIKDTLGACVSLVGKLITHVRLKLQAILCH